MRAADIVIVGSGSLAQGIAQALAQGGADSRRIAIIGRLAAKVSRIALLANARAASFGTSVTFSALAIREFRASAFAQLFRTLKPKVVLLAASLQSPWESAQEENAWTHLLRSGGFGITLPLQLALAVEVSHGAADRDAAIVNACYPDCVNVVLDRLAPPVKCGVGNAAIVEAVCRFQSGAGRGDVRVVGHHGHLGGWLVGKASPAQPRVWVKGREINALPLRPRLGPIGEDLNSVTAATATRVVLALLTGETLRTSIPGVAGWPGGYPFLLERGKFKLRLPSSIGLADAIAHNKTGERRDGIDVESNVKFIGKARRALAQAGFEYAQGFPVSEWQSARDRMIELRDRLRRTTA
jgi:hypothetical protein